MTNPNNAVGTNAAYDGRTSVKAFNDGIGAYSRGIISGWACVPDTGMTVSLGGDGNTRDVAVAQDSGGNKTTINNISESPINVTLSAAPASNSRIDAIVAYVDNPPQGSATVIDNPAACGLIAVEGTVASTPVAPNESAIRTAITADGASGATAYYVVLANITIANGTTDLTSDDIQAGDSAGIGANNIDFTTLSGNYSTTEQDTGFTWIDGKTIYKRTFSSNGNLTTSTQIIASNAIPSGATLIKGEGVLYTSKGFQLAMPFYGSSTDFGRFYTTSDNDLTANVGNTYLSTLNATCSITLYYTKSS